MNFPSPFHYVLHTVTNISLKQKEETESHWQTNVYVFRGPLTMDYFCWTSYRSTSQTAPRSPLAWLSIVCQSLSFLPSFLLVDRLSFWYLYASLISLRLSLTNNPSPLQSMTFSPNNNNNNNNNNHNQLTRVLYSTYFCQFVCLFVISPRCNKSITVPSVHYFTKSAFRSITEFLECNCMTFFSAGCALATYWPRSLYCKLLSTAQRSGLRASAPFNHHNNLEFCNLWLLTIFQLTTKLSL